MRIANADGPRRHKGAFVHSGFRLAASATLTPSQRHNATTRYESGCWRGRAGHGGGSRVRLPQVGVEQAISIRSRWS